MSHFSYCPNCQEGMQAPTAREDLIDGLYCSKGHLQPRRFTEAEWIVILYDNLQELNKEPNL